MRSFLIPLATLLFGITGYLVLSRPAGVPATDTDLRESVSESAPPGASLNSAFHRILTGTSTLKRAPSDANPNDVIALLNALSPDQRIPEIRRRLKTLDSGQWEERVALMSYLQTNTARNEPKSNRLALEELDSDQFGRKWEVSEGALLYADAVSEVYLESVDSQARAYEDFLRVIERQEDPDLRKRILGHFMARFPEITQALNQAVHN